MRIKMSVQLLKDNNIPYISKFEIEKYSNCGLPIDESALIVVDDKEKTVITSVEQLETFLEDQLKFNLINVETYKNWKALGPFSGLFAIINKNKIPTDQFKEIINMFDEVYDSTDKQPLNYLQLYKLSVAAAKSIYSFAYITFEEGKC